MPLPMIALILALALTACQASTPLGGPGDLADARPTVVLRAPNGGGVEVPVDIADAPGEWSRGLMYRSSLDGGMLFVFDAEEVRHFWMKNTWIPLDVFYFDAEGNLVSFTTMSPCPEHEEQCPTYPSAGPARYALEVNGGMASEWGVGEGWKLEAEGVPGAD